MLPPGVTSHKPNQVCKLLKSLYGLKQARRKWYEKLTSILLQQNYTQATEDHSLFIKQTDSSFTIFWFMWMTLYWQAIHSMSFNT